MRVLGAVVLAQSLFVARGQSEIRFGGGIGAKSIRDKKFRCKALLLEQLSREFHRRTFVAPALDEKVKDFALVVDGSPQPEMPSRDRNNHLVEMPARRRPRSSTTQFPGELRSELRHPSPHRLIGDVETALSEQVLDVPEAEREAEI